MAPGDVSSLQLVSNLAHPDHQQGQEAFPAVNTTGEQQGAKLILPYTQLQTPHVHGTRIEATEDVCVLEEQVVVEEVVVTTEDSEENTAVMLAERTGGRSGLVSVYNGYNEELMSLDLSDSAQMLSGGDPAANMDLDVLFNAIVSDVTENEETILNSDLSESPLHSDWTMDEPLTPESSSSEHEDRPQLPLEDEEDAELQFGMIPTLVLMDDMSNTDEDIYSPELRPIKAVKTCRKRKRNNSRTTTPVITTSTPVRTETDHRPQRESKREKRNKVPFCCYGGKCAEHRDSDKKSKAKRAKKVKNEIPVAIIELAKPQTLTSQMCMDCNRVGHGSQTGRVFCPSVMYPTILMTLESTPEILHQCSVPKVSSKSTIVKKEGVACTSKSPEATVTALRNGEGAGSTIRAFSGRVACTSKSTEATVTADSSSSPIPKTVATAAVSCPPKNNDTCCSSIPPSKPLSIQIAGNVSPTPVNVPVETFVVTGVKSSPTVVKTSPTNSTVVVGKIKPKASKPKFVPAVAIPLPPPKHTYSDTLPTLIGIKLPTPSAMELAVASILRPEGVLRPKSGLISLPASSPEATMPHPFRSPEVPSAVLATSPEMSPPPDSRVKPFFLGRDLDGYGSSGEVSDEEIDFIEYKTEEQKQAMSSLERRRYNNRVAAQRCRQRKRDNFLGLKKEIQEWECQNTRLKYEVKVLQNQVRQITEMWNAHADVCKRLNPNAVSHRSGIKSKKSKRKHKRKHREMKIAKAHPQLAQQQIAKAHPLAQQQIATAHPQLTQQQIAKAHPQLAQQLVVAAQG